MGLAMFLIKVNKSWPSVVRAPTHHPSKRDLKVRSDEIQATVKTYSFTNGGRDGKFPKLDPPLWAAIFSPSSRAAFTPATPSYAGQRVHSSTELQPDLDTEYELAHTFRRL